jgi:hypothetical protein
MVRPSGPNLAALAFYRREAAEALKARNIPAQGKHAESVRRPGYNGDYVRVPRPLWPQSAKLTGAKGAMELTCLPGVDVGGMPGIQYQWLTDYRTGRIVDLIGLIVCLLSRSDRTDRTDRTDRLSFIADGSDGSDGLSI